MKLIKLIYVFLSLILCNTAFAQVFEWGKTVGGSGSDLGMSVAVDKLGNQYYTGNFQGTVDFDPGVGVFNLTAGSGTGRNVFVLKLDPNGNFLWARQILGDGTNDISNFITTDTLGNVIVVGGFAGTANFDPGGTNLTLTNFTGFSMPFIMKLTSAGVFLWARNMNSSGSTNAARYTKTDPVGNIFVGGVFSGNMNFLGTNRTSSFSSIDGFVIKVDPNGNLIWLYTIGAGSGTDNVNSVAVDHLGDVYVTGDFRNTFDFDPSAGVASRTSAGINDAFVLKLTGAGNFVWVHQFGNTGSEVGNRLDVDGLGNVYVVGFYSGIVDLDPGAGVVNLNNSVMAKYTTNGGFVWAFQANNITQLSEMDVDANGFIYTVGNFFGTFDADPGIGVVNLTASSANNDIVFSKFDSSGVLVCALAYGGTGVEGARGVAANTTQQVYITGAFNTTTDLDPDPTVFNVNTNGSNDIYFLKLSPCIIVLPITLINFEALCVRTQTKLIWQTASEINNDFFTIERSRDAQNWLPIATINGAGNSNTIESYQFYDDYTSNEIVYYRLKQTDFDGNFEYFDVRAVKCSAQVNDFGINVYPNPTNGILSLSLTSTQRQSANVYITDIVGRKVLAPKEIAVLVGENHYSLDVSNLAEGTYLITVNSNFINATTKLIIQE